LAGHAEALEVYQSGRRTLAEELGFEPGPALRELERRILAHDPALELAGKPASWRRRRWRLLVAALAAIAVAAAAASLGLALHDDDATGLAAVPPNSVAILDPRSNEIVAAITVGASPGPIAAGDAAVWVFNTSDETVSRIELASRSVQEVIGATGPTLGLEYRQLLTAGDGSVWAGNGYSVWRVDASRGEGLLNRLRLTAVPTDLWTGLTSGHGSLWLSDRVPRVMQVNAQAGTIERTTALQSNRVDSYGSSVGSSVVAVGLGAVWVAYSGRGDRGAVFRYDPVTEQVTRIPTAGRFSAIAAGPDSVWVANSRDDEVLRVSARGSGVAARVRVGDDPAGVAVAPGAVWVANAGDGTVSRIDPFINEVVATIDVGNRPQGITVADGVVWVTVRNR
jgi:YVTN family beta-propeller protein